MKLHIENPRMGIWRIDFVPPQVAVGWTRCYIQGIETELEKCAIIDWIKRFGQPKAARWEETLFDF